MKRAVASAMTLILISVVALCPAVACPLMAAAHVEASSCCHKPQTHPAPCPLKSVPDCPYSILEKSKKDSGATQGKWVAAVIRTAPMVTLPVASVAVSVPCRLVDVGELFLRNRVLLI